MRGKALRNRVKRGVAFFLAVVMMLSTVMIVQPEKVNAATTVTEKDIYYKCPEYLDNANYTEWMYQCENVMRDGMKDVTKLDEFTASLLYSLQNGGSVILKTIAGSYGLGNDVYEELNKAVVYSVAQEYMSVSSSVSSDIADINRMFGDINTIINWHDKKQLEIFKDELKANSNLSKEQVEKLVNDFTAGSKDYEKLTKYVSNAGDIAKVVALFAELQQIDVTIIDQLMDIYKPYDTDMYNALDAIRTEHEDIVTFVMNNYVNGKVMGYIIKLVSKPLSDVKGVTDTASKILTYVLGKLTVPNATDIIKANMYLGYTYLCRNVVNNYIKEFKQGNVTDKKIKEYKLAYDFYVCTVKKTLDAVYNCVDSGNKIKKQNIETYSNGIGPMCYNGYIESCLWFAQRDVDSGKLVISNDETIRKTDDGTVMDKSYDSTESIKAKLAVIKQKYPVGMQWNDTFDGAIQCMGFAKLVFYNLYGIHMNTTYIYDHRYMYRDSGSINLVSQVSGSNVNADSIKGVMASARIGDVIQACGATYGQHSMIFMGLTDNGICVYDCNAHPDLNDSRDCVIHEWTVSYNTLASWYGSSSSTYGVNGISVYRASNYSQIYGDGTDLFYDDSVNFVIEDGVLKKYNGYQAFVEIPDTVTEIGPGAFKNNTTMLNISIPDGVKKIGNDAFYGCKNLTGVTIPDSVESIGSSAFAECSGMGTVIFPENERFNTINKSTFSNCSSLRTVDLPDSVTSIQAYAFNKNTKLNKVKLPGQLESMGAFAFGTCLSLTEINIPRTLEKAGETEYVGGWGEYGAFSYCENLKQVTFEEGTTSVATHLFSVCNGIEQITLPDTVTKIQSYAFSNCELLNKIDLPDDIYYIGERAFYYDSQLKNLKLPSSIKTIEGQAFSHCTSLSDIYIPKSLEVAGGYTFWGMRDFGAFDGCSNLKNITFENGTNKIPTFLLQDCNGIEEIDIPEGITDIGNWAYKNCSNLRKITIPETVEVIGKYVFEACTSLEEIVLPESVYEIGAGIFYNCSSLKSVTLSDKITGINEYAFYNCKKLNNINIPKAVSYIDKMAFYSCSSLQNLELNDGLKTIGNSVFRDCKNLAEISIPDSVVNMANEVFYNCSSLSKVKLSNQLKIVQANTFYECILLESIVLPDTVTEIGMNAFANCTKLTEITIPETTTKIADNAFSYPKKLTIKGVKDSYANKYADDKNIKFEAVIKPSVLDTDYIKKYLTDNEHISVDKNNETGEKYITGISRDMTVEEINSQLIGSNIVIKDSYGKEPKAGNKISTGYKMILMQNGAVKEDGDIIVKGDIDGNGSIDVLDMEAIQKSILGIGDKLSGVYKEAASLTDGDDITVLDMEAIQKDILGIQKIN